MVICTVIQLCPDDRFPSPWAMVQAKQSEQHQQQQQHSTSDIDIRSEGGCGTGDLACINMSQSFKTRTLGIRDKKQASTRIFFFFFGQGLLSTGIAWVSRTA